MSSKIYFFSNFKKFEQDNRPLSKRGWFEGRIWSSFSRDAKPEGRGWETFFFSHQKISDITFKEILMMFEKLKNKTHFILLCSLSLFLSLTLTHSNWHTNTHTYIFPQSLAQTHTNWHTYAHILSQSLSLTYTYSYKLTYSHTHTHILQHNLILTHTLTHTLTYFITHLHTHT